MVKASDEKNTVEGRNQGKNWKRMGASARRYDVHSSQYIYYHPLGVISLSSSEEISSQPTITLVHVVFQDSLCNDCPS